MSQKVAEKLSQLATRVGAIGKDGHNDHQNFDFRGIDTVMERFSLPLQEVGLVMLPSFRHIQSETVEVNGKATRFVTVEGGFTFYDTESDESLTATTIGEAADSFDKACNKAMATALKYALLQGNMVPVGDGDMDADSGPRREAAASGAAPTVIASRRPPAANGNGAKKPPNFQGMLFYRAKEAGLNSDKLAQERFGAKSSKELTDEQAKTLLDELKSNGAKAMETAAATVQAAGFGTSEEPF